MSPSGLVTLAGFALAFAGIAFVASGLQLLSLFVWREAWITAVVYLQIGLGAAGCFTGFVLTQGRGWASTVGIALSAVLALGGLAWVMWALLGGTFTLLSAFACALAVVAVLMTVFTREEVMRIHAERVALMEEINEG